MDYNIGEIIEILESNTNIKIQKINEGLNKNFTIDQIANLLEFDHDVDFVAFAKANNKCYIFDEIMQILNSNENINIKKINEGLDNNFNIHEIANLLEFDQDVDFVALARNKYEADIDEIISILKSNKNIKIKKINEGLDKNFTIDQIANLLKFDQDVDFVALARNKYVADIDEIISILKSNKNVKIQKLNEGLDKNFNIDEIANLLEFDQNVDFAAFAEAKEIADIGEIIKILKSNENINIQKINKGLNNGFKIYEIKKILNIKNDVKFTQLAENKKANGGDVDQIIDMLQSLRKI